MAYKSIYKVVNEEKYNAPNLHSIVARSSWERKVCAMLDKHKDVVQWSSESIIIPYIESLRLKKRKYYTDFYIEFRNGNKVIVEIKPKYQTEAPRDYNNLFSIAQRMIQTDPNIWNSKEFQKKFRDVINYAVNISKWQAANYFAQEHGLKFLIWTEIELRKMGLKISTNSDIKKSIKRHIKKDKYKKNYKRYTRKHHSNKKR